MNYLYEEKFSSLEGSQLASYVESLWAKHRISEQQMDNLGKQTRSQSINKLWHKHREGRITASKVHNVVHRLPSTDPSNLVCRILGYNNPDLSKVPDIKYGLDNESFARNWYSDKMQLLHENFTCRESGFCISKTEPFLIEVEDLHKFVLHLQMRPSVLHDALQSVRAILHLSQKLLFIISPKEAAVSI